MAALRIAESVGRVLGDRYRLTRPLGAGASAYVYVADDVTLRRQVAVKVLHPGLADDESFLRRFRAEAQAVAALHHPNILRVYDWGDDDGRPYLVTDLLEGGSLRAMLDRGHLLTPSQAAAVGLGAAEALAHAHRRGLVHRDIKPANLLFDEDGRVCIADFGLARALAESTVTEPAGAVVGTARYAAPEQVRGRTLDARADVYSLALVLVEATTGVVPFASDTILATLMGRLEAPLRVPDGDGHLAAVIEAAGAIDPAGRLDAGGLARMLASLARTLPPAAPLPLAGLLAAGEVTPDADPTQHRGASGRRRPPGDPSPSSVLLDRGAVPGAVPGAASEGTDHGAGGPGPPAWEAAPGGPALEERDHAAGGAATSGREGPDGRGGWLSAPPPPMARWPVDADSDAPRAVAREDDDATVVGGFGAGWSDDRGDTGAGARHDDRDHGDGDHGEGDEDRVAGGDNRRRFQRDGGGRRTWRPAVLAVLLALLGMAAGVSGWVLTHQPAPVATVPSLHGETEADAAAALQRLHLVLTVAGQAYDPSAPRGTVTGQTPAGGRLPEHQPVAVTLSLGPQPVTVPTRLAGLSQAEATKLIDAVGLQLAISRTTSPTVPAGDVIAASPSSGTRLPGDVVALVISTGRPVETVPSLAGPAARSYAAAAAALDAAHLVARQQLVYSNTVPAGSVILTQPPATTSLLYGDPVTVEVSKGPHLVTVPFVTGTVAAADQTLADDGFNVTGVTGNPGGQVRGTDPSVGLSVLYGSSIQILTG